MSWKFLIALDANVYVEMFRSNVDSQFMKNFNFWKIAYGVEKSHINVFNGVEVILILKF